MDPDAAMYEITENLDVFWNESTPKETRLAMAEHILEHFEALDGWLRRGGHLPSRWQLASGGRSTSVSMPLSHH